MPSDQEGLGGSFAPGGAGGAAPEPGTGGLAGSDVDAQAGAGAGGAGVGGAGGAMATGGSVTTGGSAGTASTTGGAAGLGAVTGSAGGAGGAPANGAAGGTTANGTGGAPAGGAGNSPASGGAGGAPSPAPAAILSANAAGTAATIRRDGPLVDPADDFNMPIGTNGRSCATCHSPEQAMSITAAGAQARFAATDGNDPLFRPVDGAVSPRADVSTVEARRAAYALLLSKGLIRVGLPIPANADFDLIAVNDPYQYASTAELSLFRRPLPAANLPFVSTVMWDGREGLVTGSDPAAELQKALAAQASHAVLGHSQAAMPLSDARVNGIVAFEMNVFSAQTTSPLAGALDAFFAYGGPLPLAQQGFFPKINDADGMSPAGLPFNPVVFTTFAAWQSMDQAGPDADARRQIARGEQLFNTRTFAVTGVPGLTTAEQPTVTVTCSTCHSAPGAGSNASARFFDLGLTTAARAGTELPLYTLQERSTGTQVIVSDPGRALITGAFKDVATFKVPTLRGLAARAPYFHNGAAATLAGVVGFYNGRFKIGLTDEEKAALTAFLGAL